MSQPAHIPLSPRMTRIRPSPTSEISERIRRLRVEGREVINLGEGELDFDTPDHIKDAAHRAIDAGDTKYTSVGGTAALKAAIIGKLARENGVHYETSEVIAGTGAKSLIYNALLATVGPGDEVIVPAPYWVSYPDMVGVAEGEARIVACGENAGWKLSPAALAAAITPRTRWLILNSPNNPTGAVYSGSELRMLADILLAHRQVLVLSDDIYEHIRYGVAFATLPQVEPRLRDRVLLVNGVSKAYSMTGWRIGFAAGPTELIAAMEALQSQSTSNAASISQAAAVSALAAGTDFIGSRIATLCHRRDLALALLEQAPGLRCARPEGAFYLFVNCAGLFGHVRPDGTRIESDLDVANYLIEEAGVGVVHGAAFGMPGYFRLAYAVETDVLHKACEAIRAACGRLAERRRA